MTTYNWNIPTKRHRRLAKRYNMAYYVSIPHRRDHTLFIHFFFDKLANVLGRRYSQFVGFGFDEIFLRIRELKSYGFCFFVTKTKNKFPPFREIFGYINEIFRNPDAGILGCVALLARRHNIEHVRIPSHHLRDYMINMRFFDGDSAILTDTIVSGKNFSLNSFGYSALGGCPRTYIKSVSEISNHLPHSIMIPVSPFHSSSSCSMGGITFGGFSSSQSINKRRPIFDILSCLCSDTRINFLYTSFGNNTVTRSISVAILLFYRKLYQLYISCATLDKQLRNLYTVKTTPEQELTRSFSEFSNYSVKFSEPLGVLVTPLFWVLVIWCGNREHLAAFLFHGSRPLTGGVT